MTNQESQAFIYNQSILDELVGEGISRQILGYNTTLMTVKVTFKKGAVGELHNHHHTQTSYIASGKFKVTINGESTILAVGDCFYVAPFLEHGVVCLEEGVLIDSFSPIREDFLF